MLSIVDKKLRKNSENLIAKPFLKWAGGKTQLINSINASLPAQVINSGTFTYVEPFVGSGAVLFWMLRTFPNLKTAVINDINEDLINTYKVIANAPLDLISILKQFEKEYYACADNEEQKMIYYYDKRTLYNSRQSGITEQAALFIFLNRTCFNGLYRVNRKNHFNVPIGSYKLPTICDTQNILAVSRSLNNVEILTGDFEKTIHYASNNTFFYLDPPYKPLSETSSFNSYAKEEFNDHEQIRLKNFCTALDKSGHKWMLSNSDLKGKNIHDDFFDELYKDYNIARVDAVRMINANADKRGALKELLITNYSYEQALSVA